MFARLPRFMLACLSAGNGICICVCVCVYTYSCVESLEFLEILELYRVLRDV